METIDSEIETVEKSYLDNTIAVKQPDAAFLLTPKSYPKLLSSVEKLAQNVRRFVAFVSRGIFNARDLSPIEKLIKDYEEHYASEVNTHSAAKNAFYYANCAVNHETNVRSVIQRILRVLSNEDLQTLLNARLSRGCTVKGALAKNMILPEAFQESIKLWQADVVSDLGTLSTLPLDLRQSIFKTLTINDARRVVHVSKSWFKELTGAQVWCEQSQSSNPYLALLRKEFYSQYMKRKVPYMEYIEVVNGEGLMVWEQGFVAGLKLNGKHIAAVWNDNAGSVNRCMVRSKILTHEEINTAVGRIESYLNGGDLDLSVLIDTIKPFMQCWTDGKYRVLLTRGEERNYCDVVEFQSNVNTSELVNTFAPYPHGLTIYCTQPVDLLNQQRVTYYEELIRAGKRPVLLLVTDTVPWTSESDAFLIDGHHKLKAYLNLNVMEEALLLCIAPATVPMTRDEERMYFNHSPDGVAQYNRASQYHYINEH